MKLAVQVVPFVAFAVLGRFGASFVCLLLQLTILGWVPAAAWASRALEDHQDQIQLQRAMDQRRRHRVVDR